MGTIKQSRVSDTEIRMSFDIGGKKGDVFFRYEKGPIAMLGESAVTAALIPAMVHGDDLKFDEPASPRLLEAMPTAQDIMMQWHPYLHRVNIEVPKREVSAPKDGRGVACFFSGGVDSCYSALKHFDEIDALIYIVGFDGAITDREEVAKRIAKMRRFAEGYGKDLILGESDLRFFTADYIHWLHYHGAALGVIAQQLSEQFHKIYIPASHTYADLARCGSHPILDPCWQTEDIELIHDGCEASRVEKVDLIATSDVSLKNLHVCWQDTSEMNCGVCEKCVRTMLNLRAAGVLEKANVFRRPLDLNHVKKMEVPSPGTMAYVRESLQYAESKGQDQELIDTLKVIVSGKYNRGIWKMGRQTVRAIRKMRTGSEKRV